MKSSRRWPHIILVIAIIYLFIPLLATLLYSISGQWQTTVLPETWTLHWYVDLVHDARFGQALLRTIWICIASIAVCLLVMLPAVFVITVYAPRWERLLQMLVLLPYAVPGVVAAVGLIKLYSSGPIAISGTVWILLGSYFVAILPYMYQGIRNSLRTVNSVELMEAAELLGANTATAFRRIILPAILPGVSVSALLSLSVLFGEFVLANLLIGGQFETIQIYLYRRLNESGHLASAVVMAYFLIILLLSVLWIRLSKRLFGASGGNIS
ncbi:MULTISPECIES: ABC transporter permease [Paenibacillus]|uniref:ABC transporter permease n=1 Tax=Paenibacillus TaxID=44249 RepID=UPI0022B8EB0D|nr:ABC transporter permease subunit [Paenibacillus caseinilyticus]MCZ8521329.1 ABC transporter permease subunit [Paenibacillus caseinilyticus]